MRPTPRRRATSWSSRSPACIATSSARPPAAVRPAAAHRVQAMDLSDQWVREGCRTDSPLLPLERAALVRAYAALLAAVHHEER